LEDWLGTENGIEIGNLEYIQGRGLIFGYALWLDVLLEI